MTQDTWQYQGRQQHGEWGHGTAPRSASESDNTGRDTSTSEASYLQFVADQGGFHREVQAEIESLLRSNGVIFESNVGLQGYAPDPRTGLPQLARIDMIVMHPGQPPIGVEIKTGRRPSYTDPQRVVYPQLMVGHAFSPDPKIRSFGFDVNEPLPPMPILVCYQRAAGLPRRCEYAKLEDILE